MDTKFFDGIYGGDSANGAKLGMGLTGGDFWPRVEGCCLLYRGLGMERIDFSRILAVAGTDAIQIGPPAYVSHNSNTEYFYILRKANHCGDEEKALGAAAKVAIDADGELADSLHLRWIFKTGDMVKSSPVIGFNNVYIGSSDGNVYAVDITTGKPVWTFTTDAAVEAPPLLIDSTIYVGSLDYFLYALHALTGELQWKYETEGKIAGSANWSKK